MPLIAVGLNHKTAPIGLLERLAIADEQLPKALHELDNREHLLESVVLSTCNRIEIYAAATKFHGGAQDLRNFLAEFCHVAPEDFVDHLYTYHDEGAVGHLFRVVSGIDSMIVGESEILGQVRRAFQTAVQEGAARRVLGAAFRQALRVGKRARTETAIGRNPISISSAAVDLARRAFEGGSLEGKKVLIVGAGKMGHLAARALAASGATDVTIANRTEERARALAHIFDARSVGLEDLGAALTGADIAICSTTATETVLSRDVVARAAAARGGRPPLLVVDIAVPRDVDPAAASIEGVILRDIDDLRGVVESGLGSRLAEVAKVESIIAAEIQRFVGWERATQIAPTVGALVDKAESIRASEVRRAVPGFEGLTAEQRAMVDQLTKRIVAKLLHAPIDKAKELASSKQGDVYRVALRELFELDDEPDP
ncbi:MAG: glutamyl-tRNA reductase [Actinomycetota bacterium]